ncbi:MAG: manganese transport protein [Bacteroidota bacterium]|nr:manganese transport protein [Bacteroidota bacterium]
MNFIIFVILLFVFFKIESIKCNMQKSLSEVYESVDALNKKGYFKKLFAFFGPAYLVSVGYMDPGNWATDIAGGSKFGYDLIWVLLLSNLMALVLQSLAARLGIVTKMDLAQASRASYPKMINYILYVFAELAIAATDLAEVLGMAIGLNLLFGLPLIQGVTITIFDTILLLYLQKMGIRKMEAFIICLISIIGLSFLLETILAAPQFADLAKGFIPSLPGNEALYIAIGIIGATVMPHNLYLHSSLVQTRIIPKTSLNIRKALKYNFIDSMIALNIAFFVNTAILVLAAATFHKSGMLGIDDITVAHKLLEPLLGTKLAPILFAVALIAAGQSSTVTGTLSGQIVMEGYISVRLRPWLRRLITRLLAIIPAYIVILMMGEGKTGALLIFSQVFLSLQLGFAIIPLIHLVSDKKKMGEFVIKRWLKIVSWLIAVIIVTLNVKLVIEEMNSWLIAAGDYSWLIWLIVLPIAVMVGALLVYIAVMPFIRGILSRDVSSIHKEFVPAELLQVRKFDNIAVSIDFTDADSKALSYALSIGQESSHYLLMHIIESAPAVMFNNEIDDDETVRDKENLEKYAEQLRKKGLEVSTMIGFGTPKYKIPEIVKEAKSDILIMGAHGHKYLKDLILGTTVEYVRHNVNIPVMIVKD